MDFKTLGSSLINAFTADDFYANSHRKKLQQILGSDQSSASLITRNIVYTSSSSMTRQQSFEIHIDSVHLSDVALKTINGKYKKCVGIRICWIFMNYECSTPIIQVNENIVKMNDLQKYTITLNDVFIKYITKHNIQFDLYGIYENKEKLLGRSQLDVRNLLYCSEKDIFRELDIIAAHKRLLFKRCQNTNNTTIGTLLLRYNLHPINLTEVSKNIDECEVKELYHRLNQTSSSEQIIQDDEDVRRYLKIKRSPAIEIYKQNEKHLKITLSDYCHIYDILNKILEREEFSTLTEEELTLRNYQKRENLKKSIEEYAILCGKTPSTLAAYTRDTIRMRNYDAIYNYEQLATIHVISLHMDPNRFALNNNQVKELYVEYSFLSRRGKDMETLSLPLLENLIIEYNFKRTFLLDSNQNSLDCKILTKMIKEQKSINFMIIEEPIEDINQFQVCKEIGIVEINLFQLIQTDDNVVTDLYPVKDIRNLDQQIGYLKIKVGGVQAMRNTALKYLKLYGNIQQTRK